MEHVPRVSRAAPKSQPRGSRAGPPSLALIVPCYNEEAVVPESARQFDGLLARLIEAGKVTADSTATFVDDGSSDSTWAQIEKESSARPRIRGIKLSGNRGQQNAMLAGMMYVEGDVIVTVDADLQDDINAIEGMVDEYARGCDVVYGVRSDRSTDTFFKRTSAVMFYRLLAFLGVDVVHNHSEFRLMSRRAIEALREYREGNLYLRGIVPHIGMPSACVTYARRKRIAGETKYPIGKLIRLAIEAVTSFSTTPLRLITILGFVVFLGAVGISVWALWSSITGRSVPGWASTVLPLYFLSGLQILCIGILGAYLGRVYTEVKARPRFLIDRTTETPSARQTPIELRPARTNQA
jgi:glycosyltransferase involved in cell wall biosynthesis